MTGQPADRTPHSPRRLPLMVDVTGRRVLVVGGGPVGCRRARYFADGGALVAVVTATAPAEALPDGVTVAVRPADEQDLDGVWLVVLATDDAELNRRFEESAAARGVLCNRADAGATTEVAVPAALRRDGLVVAVATESGDAARSVVVRDRLAAHFELLAGSDRP